MVCLMVVEGSLCSPVQDTGQGQTQGTNREVSAVVQGERECFGPKWWQGGGRSGPRLDLLCG